MKKKIITAVVVIVVLLALVLVGRLLVSNLNIVEIIKKIHGG